MRNRKELENFRSGHWHQRFQDRSFEPAHINQEWTRRDQVINELPASAGHAPGQPDVFSRSVPDADHVIEMIVLKEAQTSRVIEGARTRMEEVLLKEEYFRPERCADRQEALNCIKAFHAAVREPAALPLSCGSKIHLSAEEGPFSFSPVRPAGIATRRRVAMRGEERPQISCV